MEYIDIIMPVYNGEKYIKDSLESIKKQTNPNWKLIIINDASIDNSIEEINQNIVGFENKVLLIDLKEHVGVAKARNIGMQNSKNRYIAFLDADDIWKENKLEKQIEFMQKNKYDFTYTKYTYLYGKKEKKVIIFVDKLDYKQALKNTYILTSTVIIDTKGIDRKLIEMPEVGSEDTATWWNILKNKYIAYGYKEALTVYRCNPKGLSSNKFINIRKTWNLYRKYEKIGIIKSIYYFMNYAYNATLKRII